MRGSRLGALVSGCALVAVLAGCTPTGTTPSTTTTDAPDPTTTTTTVVTTTTTLPPPPPGSTLALTLPSSTAFAVLGASCGGIQEQAFATGFDPVSGGPTGDVYLQTRCGGSGRGGGYHVTTYSAWVGVVWDLTATVVSSTKLAAAPAGLDPAFTAFDAAGDEVVNTLSAVNVTPASCTVGNTTYCSYRAALVLAGP